MTGFAVASFLQTFSWKRVGIIMERQLDIIWKLTKDGLEHALQEEDVLIAKSTLITSETILRDVIIETAKESRGKTYTTENQVQISWTLICTKLHYLCCIIM